MRKKIYIFFILLIPTIIFFSGTIFSENTFFYSDTTYLFRPFKVFIINELNNFSLPQWNPFFNGGMPLISDPVMQIFYPLNIIFFLFPFASAYKMFVVFHYIIAGFFTYLLAMEINRDRKTSLFCAISYSFSGYLVFIHYNLPFLAGGAFLPLFFYGALKLSSTRTSFLSSFPYCAITSIAMTLQFFGGDIEIVYIELIILAFLFFFNLSRKRDEGFVKLIKDFAGKFSSIFLIFAGTASVLAVPLLYLYPATTREAGINYSEIYKFSFHPLNFFEFAFPNIYGNSTTGERVITAITDNSINSFSGEWSSYLYCGSIVFLFFIFFLLGRKKKKIEIFFISLFTLSFMASCGNNLPIYPLLLKILPFFSSFRYPGKLIIFAALSVSILSGIGFSKWNSANDKKILRGRLILSLVLYISLYPISLLLYRVISGKWVPLDSFSTSVISPIILTAISITILFLSQKNIKSIFSKNRASTFILIILFTDLLIPGYQNLFLIDETFFRLKPLALTKLEENNPESKKFSYRIFRSENFKSGFDYPQLKEKTNVEKSIIFKQNTLREGAGVKYSTLYLGTYSSYVLKNFRTFETAFIGTTFLMNIMNTKYFIAPEDEAIRSPYNIIYRHPLREFAILENKEYLPRSFLVQRAHFFKNNDEILSYMKREDFNPLEEVLLSANNEEPERELSGLNKSFSQSRSEIITYKPNEVKIQTVSHSPSYLVLCDTWFPGWSASVDGKAGNILRANYNFRAVFVPAGEHQIVFSFLHPGLYTGLAISLLTFAIMIFIAIYRQFTIKIKKT